MPPAPRFRHCLAALLALASGALAAQGYPRTPADYLRQMDTDGDGTLEAAELPGGRGRPVSLKAWQADLRRQFHRLDRNRDGFLDARELAAPPG
jgi:hypothetical protein